MVPRPGPLAARTQVRTLGLIIRERYPAAVPMELSFATKTLRSLCEDEDAAVQKFGKKAAAELRARIADLRAADSVADIVAGAPRFFEDDPRMTISVLEELEIVLRPNHLNMPLQAAGGVDWSHVRRLRIDKLNQLAGGG